MLLIFQWKASRKRTIDRHTDDSCRPDRTAVPPVRQASPQGKNAEFITAPLLPRKDGSLQKPLSQARCPLHSSAVVRRKHSAGSINDARVQNSSRVVQAVLIEVRRRAGFFGGWLLSEVSINPAGFLIRLRAESGVAMGMR